MWWGKIVEILRAVYDGTSSLNVTLVGGAVGGQAVAQGDPNADDSKGWKVRLFNGTGELLGRLAAAASIPVVLSTEDKAALDETSIPTAALAVGELHFTVDDTEAALVGAAPRGYLLFNNSSGGQVIYFGDTGLSTSTGFPLRPGDAIDRPTWQNLSVVFALASADGADLRAVPL